jgi:hypothetical protein
VHEMSPVAFRPSHASTAVNAGNTRWRYCINEHGPTALRGGPGSVSNDGLRFLHAKCLVSKSRPADHCIFEGAAVPSDHLSARMNRTVTCSSGSLFTMTGELGSLAAQLLVMSPGE